MSAQWQDLSQMQPMIQELIQKALGTATGSGALFDDVRDRAIAEELDKRHPLWANLNKPTGQGANFLFSRKTDRALGADWIAETGQVSTADASYATISEVFRLLDAVGSFTALGQAAGRGFIELQRQALNDTLDDWEFKVEDGILDGTGTGNEPTGLNVFHDADTTNQILAGTNGAVLTLDLMDRVIDLVTDNSGRPGMFIMASRTRRELNALLQVNQRFLDKVKVNGGFRVQAYDEIPIFDSNAVDIDEVVGTSGSTTSRLQVLDKEAFFIPLLMPPRPFTLARTKASVQDFEVLSFLTFVIKNRIRIAQIKGLISPP